MSIIDRLMTPQTASTGGFGHTRQLKAGTYPGTFKHLPNQTRPDPFEVQDHACPVLLFEVPKPQSLQVPILHSAFCACAGFRGTSTTYKVPRLVPPTSLALPVPRRPKAGPVRCGFHLALESSLTHSLTLILTFASSPPSTTPGVSPSPRRLARRRYSHRRLPNLQPTTVFRTTTRPPVTLPPVAARAWHNGGQGISRLG